MYVYTCITPVQSGLTAACKASQMTLADTEQKMLAFVKEHVPAGRCPLAGNTIHMDKRFLDKYMPQLMAHLHYRIVDVSSVKELCRYVHCNLCSLWFLPHGEVYTCTCTRYPIPAISPVLITFSGDGIQKSLLKLPRSS